MDVPEDPCAFPSDRERAMMDAGWIVVGRVGEVDVTVEDVRSATLAGWLRCPEGVPDEILSAAWLELVSRCELEAREATWRAAHPEDRRFWRTG